MSASKAFAFSLALLLGAGGQASAQNTVTYDEPIVSDAQSSGSVSGSTPIGIAGGYFWVQGDFGQRPGIQGNYASFGSFAPIDFLGPDQRFFADVQAMVSDDANIGASGGLGYRRLVESWGSIFGVNGFYTFDQSQRGLSYNQGGAGAEWLTEFFQVTANVYVPFSTQPNNIGPVIQTKNSIFENNNLAFINIQNAETQLRGADVEVGVPIPGMQWLSVHGGAYYLDGSHAESINGVRGRVQADLTNVLLNLSYADDDRFGGQVNFAATYLFGAQSGNYNPRVKSLYDRLNDRVRRTSRIATQDVVINPHELAINPLTGLPWTFAHFDNTAAAGGDGSNENRFNSLVASDPADALLFHRGTTTRTNVLTGATGVTLNDNQLVFGEGCPTFIDVLNRPGVPCPLPTWDTAGTNPFVGSAAGNVFTLADNNRIAGLNIIAPTGGNAIAGNGIQNFTLEKLNRNVDPTIPGPNGTTGTGGGIVINNATGTGIIRDFGFNIPSATGPSGIVITNSNTAPLDVSITDGRFLNGGRFGIQVAANNAQVTTTINNVNNTGSSTGLQLQATNGGDVVANVTNSHFDNAVGAVVGSGDGIAMIGNNSDLVLNVTNTTATGALRDGLHVDLGNGAQGTINANTVNLSGSGDDSIFTNLNDSKLNLTAVSVNGSGAGDDGLDFRLSNTAVLNAAISGSNLSNAVNDGIVGSLTGGSQANLIIASTTIADAGGNGLFVTNSGTSQFVGSLTNSSLDSANLNGVRLDTAGTSRSTLVLNNSDATNAGLNGLLSTAVGNSRADLVLTDQGFDNAGLDAINLTATTDSLILVSGNRVSGANAGDDGIQITANDGRVGLTWVNTGSFASPNGDGITFTGTNNSLIGIDIDGAPSSFNGAGGNGVIGSLTDSRGVLNLTDVTFQNAALEGIGITALNSTFQGAVSNGSFNNAGSNGARLTLSNSTGTLTLDNTDLFNAGGDGLLVNATNGSGALVNLLNGISLDSAGDDAIDVNVTDSTALVTGSQVSGNNAVDDAIHLNSSNGQIGLLLASAGSFTAPGGDGIDFMGTNASILNIQVQGFPLSDFNNAGGNGVIGVLSGGSNATLGLVNTSFNNAALEGLGVTATDSIFNGTVSNGSFVDAGGNAARLTLNNSTGNLTLSNVQATGAGGHGVVVSANNNSTSGVALVNGVTLDNAALDAINITSNAGSTVTLFGSGVTGSGAGDDGIDVTATNSSAAAVVLNPGGSFANAGGDGIAFLANNNSNVAVIVNGPGASFDGAGVNGVNGTVLGGSLGTLVLNDVTLRNVGNDGIRATVDGVSLLNGDLTNVSLDNATGDAFDLFASNNSRINMVGTGVSGPNAGGDAIKLLANTLSRIDMNLSATGSFASAGDDGIDFTGTGGSAVNVVVSGNPSSFDGAGDNGIIGTLNGSTGTLNLTNATFANAGTDGLHLDLTNSTLGGSIVGSNFSNAGQDGVEVLLNASGTALNLTNTLVDNVGVDAIHLEASNASLLNMKFTGGSLLNAGGDMTDITFIGGSVVNFNLDPVATGAAQNGLRFNGTTNSRLNAIISNSPMSIAGATVGENGILGTLDTNAVANVKLVNSDIANATQDGINVVAQGNSTFNATIINSQVSNAGGNGLDLTLTNATSNVTFDNSDLNNAGGDAIHVNGTNSRFNLNLTGGINLDDAGGDAIDLVATSSVFNVFGNQAVTANRAGSDAIHINASTASVVNSTFASILDLDDAGDNAIDVAAVNSTANVIGRGLATGANAGDDAIHLDGTVANLSVQLFNAGSFANAGGDGIDVTGSNSSIGVRFRGAAAGAANLDGATGNGIIANLTNGSLAQFDVNNFSIQNEGLNGVSFGLNNARIVNSVFTNGQVDNNGLLGVPGSRDGLRIVAVNNSNIGTRAGQVSGLTFDNVSFQNDSSNPRPQQHGIEASVDGNSFMGLTVRGANIVRNDGDAVLLNVNPDASLNDSSLAVLNFTRSIVSNNWGDGFHVTATNGIDDVVPPQLSGAIINFFDGQINGNGDFINAPATGVIGNGIGDGIDATANGDNSVAGNTQITFNLNDADILGNEEQALRSSITNGGSVNFNLVGGAIDGTIEVPCADGPLAYVEFTLNGTSVASSSQLVLCAKNNGTLIANVGNVDFSNNNGQGIIMLAESGGDITANLFHLDVRNNGNNIASPIPASVNPPITTVTGAIQGVVDGAGSTINLTGDELVVVNNRQAGLDLTVSNGGDLNAAITNSNFSNNGLSGVFDGMLINASGLGSTATVNLGGANGVKVDNATDDGLDFRSTGGATFDLTMSRVSAMSAGADGLSFLVDGGTGSLSSTNLDVDDADGRAVNLIVDNAGSLNVTALNNVAGRNAGLEGLNLDVLNGSTLNNFNSETLNFSNSGRINPAVSGIDILVNNGSITPVIVLNDVNADNAGGNGLLVTANDGTVTLPGVTVVGGSFVAAGSNGVEINVGNQAVPTTLQLTDVNANNAGNYGILLNVNSATGGQSDIVLNHVTANNAVGNDGLEINVTGLGATDSTQVIVSNGSTFNNAGNEGIDINLSGADGSYAEMIFSAVSANDATNDGINISPTGGLDLFVGGFLNVNATGAGGDGLDVQAGGASSLRLFNGNTVNVSGAGGDGVVMSNVAPTSGPTSITFNGLNASTAGGNAVDINLDAVPGDSTISLSNVNATGALGGDAIDLRARMTNAGDSTAIVLNTVDVSNSAGDGLNVRLLGNTVLGNTTATLALNGLTSTGSVRDGIDIGLDDAVTATVTQFNNVIARSNRENGMQIDVEGSSVLTQFTADGVNLSDNAISGIGFDGLDVQVHDAGSAASFNLSNLTIDNSGGRGIDLDVYDSGTLTFNVATASVANSGIGGIDVNVGMIDENHNAVPTAAGPGTFNSNLTNVTVVNSGVTPLNFADGVNIDVDGAGSVANVTLDHVLSNNNDQDGFDINVDNGANGTFVVNNATTGNTNAGTGFEFTADGAATIVSLTSAGGVLGDNTFNNNFGDALTPLDGPGVSVVLTNAVTATNLVIGASATGNDGDGLQVIANDGTGVTINNFGVSGTALQVNNNAGNGLFVDFFNVNGVNAFDLANVTVTGNALDQIHAEFRGMTMDHIALNNVTATGIGSGVGDGIEIVLLDTLLTRPTANGYAFSAIDVVSTNNGGFGLNLNVDEAGIPNAIQTAGIPNGLIHQSEFANNDAAGVRMRFGGDSVNNFDIFQNTAGFHNNGQEGILIEVQDDATFVIGEGNSPANVNLILPGRSMYENQITNNGGIGFHVVASEPLDVTNVVADAVGPRIELHLGDPDRNPNVITGNTDAAMAIEMTNDATGQFTISSSILSNTVNGANANFNGDGLAFRLTDFAALESLTLDGATSTLSINDNAGSGLVTNVNRFSRLGTTSRLTVLNSTIQRNQLHGIDIQRNDTALYGPNAANNAIIIGSANNGNLIRDNVRNGVNIVLNNTPGAVQPLDIDITDNTFERNLNGIFLNATGNAQFNGNISDNDFDGQRQDGIQVMLENDAALGDSLLANNPLRTPFLFEGNQILNSARDGIRFDTNFTNELGNFGGGAYANVLITESANFVDGFAAPIRTLIDGNGVHGVHIIDNSDFAGNLATSVVTQNTYRIFNSDITNNTVDGVHLNVANNAGIRDANNGVALIIGDPTNADQRDVQISLNGDDGIELELADADANTNNIRITNTTVSLNGATGDATGGNGIYSNVLNAGSMDMYLEHLDVIDNIDDGLRFDVTTTRQNEVKTLEGVAQTVNAVTLVEMFGVNASGNGGRGLYASLEHDRVPANTFNSLGPVIQQSTSVFNIGRGDRFNDATAVNRFNSNDREGLVFDLQATNMDQDNTTRPNGWPHPNGTDANDDVFVDVNQPSFLSRNPAWSTDFADHPILGLNSASTSGLEVQETTRNLTSTVNFIQNEAANNGTNFEDGLAFGVGALTRLNSLIAGSSFGGNVGDDIRVYPQRSNEINPPDSFQDNDVPGHTYVVYDPVAYVDLVFGRVDTNLDGVTDLNRGNGRSVDANGAASDGTGAGEQIQILTFGTPQTNQITTDGVFTNNDPVKGGNRPVLLVGQIQSNGVWNSEVVNDFFQNGVQQQIDPQFLFFNQNGTGPFPDGNAAFPGTP